MGQAMTSALSSPAGQGIQESYQFNATVKSKGQQQKGTGWAMTLDWKLPGSRFELVLYGQDWDEVHGRDIGDRVYCDIAKGGLKEGKNGKYASDYFWNLNVIDAQRTSVKAAPAQEPTPEPETETRPAWQNPPPQYARNEVQESIQTRIAWNSAVNNAIHLLQPLYTVGDTEPVNFAIALHETAVMVYQLIIAGPPQGDAPSDAPEAAAPPEAPEPRDTPPQAAKAPQRASSEALGRLNGARQAALARHHWTTEQESLAAIQGFAKRIEPTGREVRQLSDAEVDQVTAAVRDGKL